MKKNLILAAVAVLAVGQAAYAAGPEGKDKPEAVKGKQATEAKGKAEKTATKGADAKASNPTMKAVRDAKLKTASAEHEAVLGRLSSDPVMKAVIDGIAKQAEKFPELAQARLDALILADIAKIDTGVTAQAMNNFSETGKLEQAYRTLAENAGDAANGWPPNLRENLTFLLKTANKLISEGHTVADAMTKANAELFKSRQVSLDLSKINEYCKK